MTNMKLSKTRVISKDNRGEIIKLLDFSSRIKFKSVLFIKSKKGAVRANHYHKNDSHYTCLLFGKFRYYEKGLNKKSKIKNWIISPGDIVITQPKIIHTMEFLENSTLVVFTTESRNQAKYEKDLVRIKLV